jgi:hypothetical protein
MPKEKVPLQQLQEYLPDDTYDAVIHYLQQYSVQLTITRQRQSILGDYRHAWKDKGHRISVNGNLNKFSFLITLLHELAHLLTFDQYNNKVQPHGKEWKTIFGKLLSQFIEKKVFPDDITQALLRSIHNPSASSCGDTHLLRTLQQYDKKKEGVSRVENLSPGSAFIIKGGRKFILEEKIRTRFKCKEIETGKSYLFNGLYEVKLLS